MTLQTHNRPNLVAVAKAAGVSRSTVSRVINDDPNVNAATRERVWSAIHTLDYQPNRVARGLASGRTQVLGLVIPQGVATLFSDPYFAILIQGISTACSRLDYSVMLWLAEPDHERRTIHQVLHGGLIDGVIVSSMLADDPIIAALVERRMPCVLVGRHPDHPEISTVDTDNLSGARAAVTHLLRLGRRRVATITGPQNMIAGADRCAGYSLALRDAGFSADPALIVESDFTEAGGYRAMQQLLPHHPDAVFAASDLMALGALRALQHGGLRVPEDVAVIGFDDIAAAALADPPLTSVRQSIQQLGHSAVELLLTQLDGSRITGPEHRVFPPTLVVRRSCGGDPA
ncbi:MAG TPA: LacI family DNA-binding transcriptional regulator [Anaerolineales bacterium]|nr:LacI family DNA-binding transcriptional regulator [Anaerolineales bacterium]HRF48522.1 LacI family DNA-binding transcriptional regulator [Anaerolineales bacterium]